MDDFFTNLTAFENKFFVDSWAEEEKRLGVKDGKLVPATRLSLRITQDQEDFIHFNLEKVAKFLSYYVNSKSYKTSSAYFPESYNFDGFILLDINNDEIVTIKPGDTPDDIVERINLTSLVRSFIDLYDLEDGPEITLSPELVVENGADELEFLSIIHSVIKSAIYNGVNRIETVRYTTMTNDVTDEDTKIFSINNPPFEVEPPSPGM